MKLNKSVVTLTSEDQIPEPDRDVSHNPDGSVSPNLTRGQLSRES